MGLEHIVDIDELTIHGNSGSMISSNSHAWAVVGPF